MSFVKWILCPCFVLEVLLLAKGGASYISDEQRLFTNLTKNYQRSLRPVRDQNDTLAVHLGFALTSIEELDEATGSLKSHAWLRMLWKDVSLTWDPADYNNVDHIRIPVYMLWMPDIILYNNMEKYYRYKKYVNAIVSSDGSVLFIPDIRLHSSCPMDLSQFPYDEHTCNIRLGSWTWDGSQINLTKYSNEILDKDDFTGNVKWELKESSAKINSVVYSCCPAPYQDLTVTLKLKRRSSYAVHMLFAPSAALALVTPAVFLMPAESREKSTLAIGVLISQVILLHMLEGLLPASHFATPSLGIHMICNIVLMALCLVVTTLINNIWCRGHGTKAMSGCVRTVFLTVLGRLLFVTSAQPLFMPSDGFLEDESPDGGKTSAEANEISREWRQLSVVFDRLFFVLYLIVVLLVMFITYH